MDKRITLNKLLSYIQSISEFDAKDDYDIASFKNDLSESQFKILKFGETVTLGDLPKKLKTIFDPFISDMKRIGVLPNKNKTTNISLIYSVLYCIKSDFLDLSNADKINCIDQFTDKMLSDIGEKQLYKNYEYKGIGWNKKEFIETIDKYKNNIMTLRFLSDYLHVNIFLLNANEDKIYAIYPEEEYNIFKTSILLSFYDNVFEPIVYKNNNVWNNDMEPLKKLINIDKKYIGILNCNFKKNNDNEDDVKIFTVGSENLSKYLINDNKNDNEDKSDDKNDNEDKSDDKNDNEDKSDDKNNENEEADEDNEFDEVYIKDAEIEPEICINDIEETEMDDQTVKNEKDIFYVNQKKNNKNKDFDDEESELIATISKTMKLDDMQVVAKKFNIDLAIGQYKNGKSKMKTKTDLYNDIITKIKNN
jgi:hypothetical protein